MQYPTPLLYVYWETSSGKVQRMDVRDYVKDNMTQSRLTQKYIDKLTEQNAGRQVDLVWNTSTHQNEIKDLGQLIIP